MLIVISKEKNEGREDKRREIKEAMRKGKKRQNIDYFPSHSFLIYSIIYFNRELLSTKVEVNESLHVMFE